jgi:adenylate kinase family enzyme
MTALYEQVWKRYSPAHQFLEYVDRALEEHGITQAALAERIDVSSSLLCEWLQWGRLRGRSNHRKPTLQSLVLIDEALDQLISDKREVQP